MSQTITRTVAINDLTPQELAHLFTEMGGTQQAKFFSEIWTIAKAWRGAGWCQQSLAICEEADSDARNAISTLAAHLASVPAA